MIDLEQALLEMSNGLGLMKQLGSKFESFLEDVCKTDGITFTTFVCSQIQFYKKWMLLTGFAFWDMSSNRHSNVMQSSKGATLSGHFLQNLLHWNPPTESLCLGGKSSELHSQTQLYNSTKFGIPPFLPPSVKWPGTVGNLYGDG